MLEHTLWLLSITLFRSPLRCLMRWISRYPRSRKIKIDAKWEIARKRQVETLEELWKTHGDGLKSPVVYAWTGPNGETLSAAQTSAIQVRYERARALQIRKRLELLHGNHHVTLSTQPATTGSFSHTDDTPASQRLIDLKSLEVSQLNADASTELLNGPAGKNESPGAGELKGSSVFCIEDFFCDDVPVGPASDSVEEKKDLPDHREDDDEISSRSGSIGARSSLYGMDIGVTVWDFISTDDLEDLDGDLE